MSARPRPASARLPARSDSPFRRLARPWLSPRVFDFWASRLHPTWSWERPLARIVERRAESADAVTLVLRPNRHWHGCRPGQHLNVSAEIDGCRVTRSYSPTGLPGRDRRVAITVKAVDGGKLSRHLCERAKVGDVLDLGPAFGDMQLDENAATPRLFLAAGSGITPLIALTRTLAAGGMPAPLTLLYWARKREQLCFVDELRGYAAAHPRFQLRFLLTGEAADAADEGQGRIDAAQLATIADLADREVYACGPGGFVDEARALLAAGARSFQAEAFSPPPRTQEDLEGTVEITLAASARTLTVARGQSLLGALEAQGLKLASGCRMGICNTCACGKRSGSTRHLHTGDAQHEPVSALRLCVNSATSDLVLDL
ncbi:MAG: ferredoxin reductase [Lysobacter sp.]|nr:ferredoxin reductase [Lysobacter sp.]